MEWIDWREHEANIPLERLPDFHRAFLRSRGVVNPEQMMLRRVQQSVERELNTLCQAGLAKNEEGHLWVAKSVLDAISIPD
ncbi:MAG: hypothetical protein ACK41E_09385 [Deinococcales bacterium]